jgi:hypothetical protein
VYRQNAGEEDCKGERVKYHDRPIPQLRSGRL